MNNEYNINKDVTFNDLMNNDENNQKELFVNEPVKSDEEQNTFDTEMMKQFIGKKYGKFLTKKFNFSAFLFGGVYLIYRKIYLLGIIYSFLLTLLYQVEVNYFVNDPSKVTLFSSIIFVTSVIINIIIGIRFNKSYVNKSFSKIKSIEEKSKLRPDSYVFNVAHSKGGTSFFMVILLLALIGAGSTKASEFIVTNLNERKTIPTIKSIDNLNNNTSINNDVSYDKYEGVLPIDTNIRIADNFSVAIPNTFKNNSEVNKYSYEYITNDTFKTCKFELYGILGFNNHSLLINQMAEYDKDTLASVVSKSVNNNIEWYWYSKNDSFGKKYTYATNKGGKIYIMNYQIDKDAPAECENSRLQIISSVK